MVLVRGSAERTHRVHAGMYQVYDRQHTVVCTQALHRRQHLLKELQQLKRTNYRCPVICYTGDVLIEVLIEVLIKVLIQVLIQVLIEVTYRAHLSVRATDTVELVTVTLVGPGGDGTLL